MATRSSSRDTGSHRIGSQIKATAVLLGIYIAMYLAVWVILRALTSSDAAAAIAPANPMAQSVVANASNAPTAASESPSSDFDQVSGPVDGAGGCRPSAATDSMSGSD
jgi:hypothetical protein